MARKMPEGTLPTAEQRFRAAFHRLRDGCPQVLPLDSKVSQNNVAREAGCDPSALKKSRFPTLVAEIQACASKDEEASAPSPSEPTVKGCSRCARLKEQLRQVTQQRDAALSALVQADARALELAQRVLALEESPGPTATAGERYPKLVR